MRAPLWEIFEIWRSDRGKVNKDNREDKKGDISLFEISLLFLYSFY